LLERAIEDDIGLRSLAPDRPQVHRSDQDSIDVYAERHRRQLAEASHEKAGSGQ
jgi:hypothetical protein